MAYPLETNDVWMVELGVNDRITLYACCDRAFGLDGLQTRQTAVLCTWALHLTVLLATWEALCFKC